MIRTAFLGVAAAAMLVGVAPQAQAQSLSNPFNCDRQGGKQTGGAVIGGLVGGLAGAGVARNDALGAIVGGALGAAAGSWLGCRMGTDDRASLETATVQALNDGRNTTWDNPRTGASARINVMADTAYGQPAYGQPAYGQGGYRPGPRYGDSLRSDQVRLGQRIAAANAYETVAPRYTAVSRTNIRSGPSTNAQIFGQLNAGERFDAIAKVRGQPWVLVGRNGYGAGYVHESNIRAEFETVTSSYATPISAQSLRLGRDVSWANGYVSAPSTFTVRSTANLRSAPTTSSRSLGQVYRGDEIEALAKVEGSPWILVGRQGRGIGYVNEQVLDARDSGGGRNPGRDVSSNCRIVEQQISMRNSASETQRMRACRNESGRWDFTGL